MTAPEGPVDRGDDVPHEWSELDDTLADGPAAASAPGEAKEWLASQRFLHGLLRALHTADAQDREGRVQRILARLGEAGAAASLDDGEHELVGAGDGAGDGAGVAAIRPANRVREWFVFAAAAALLGALTLWAWLPAELPTIDAAVQRVAQALGNDVDRKFTLEIEVENARGGTVRQHRFDLTARPGMRFLVDGSVQLGSQQLPLRIVCDGETVWFAHLKHAEPLAKAERLLARMGDVLDVGYLDVQALIRRLPADFPLRTVERRLDPATGKNRIRIATDGEPDPDAGRQRSAWLEFDEATGLVERLEFVAVSSNGSKRKVTFAHLGRAPAGTVEYRRPW